MLRMNALEFSSKPRANMMTIMPISAKSRRKIPGFRGSSPILTSRQPMPRNHSTGMSLVRAAAKCATKTAIQIMASETRSSMGAAGMCSFLSLMIGYFDPRHKPWLAAR